MGSRIDHNSALRQVDDAGGVICAGKPSSDRSGTDPTAQMWAGTWHPIVRSRNDDWVQLRALRSVWLKGCRCIQRTHEDCIRWKADEASS